MGKFDVTVLGELLIDMTYAGKSEAGQTLFEQNPGGAVANVAVAVGRLGGKTAFIGKVGRDMHGDFLRETLERENVNTDSLYADESVFTTLAFVALDENGDRSFSFARKPGADICLTKEEVPVEVIKNTKIFHTGSLSLTDEPCKTASLFALSEAKKAGCILSYDPNYRAPLWESEEKAVEEMRSVLSFMDIIKISDTETALLTGAESPEEASSILSEGGIPVVIVTLGKDGAIVRTKDGLIRTAAVSSNVVDTTGAGDSFMGGFLWKVAESGKAPAELSLEEVKEFADFASRVAGKCVEKRGGIPAMPHIEEL